ncbi:hypothetical protein [Mangrovibacterium diazotrophicum]|uniref:DnaJ central domain-containing protein n=1 Tax=Mangrovibacterium diazotrophicum TaxID=1261403 RepID=A0A419W7L0_9BACT|nr:hypothetical protein [Mangrovibacterium diazotrophicum]RKD91467.1 DnaJ central domain-containing protein [Mangrovibacterium diazotrophicum]
MEGYFLDETIRGDKDLILRMKRQINQWAATYKIDEFKYLANKIEFGKITYKPEYPAYLRSQLEQRKKKEDNRPYTNQSVPDRIYFSLSQLNIWDPDLPLPKKFIEQTKSFIVPGSQFVKTCHHCSGHGKITCPSCSGEGQVTCSSCKGAGKQQCSSCNGKGNVSNSRSCSNCGGRGRWTTYEDRWNSDLQRHISTPIHNVCDACNATGYRYVTERCTRCRGTGQTSCSNCGGTGKVTCSRCHGHGEIVCPTCEGRKRLYHYLAIDQELSNDTHSIIYINENFEDDFQEFAENWSEIEGKPIFGFSSNGIMRNPVEATHDLYKSVGDIIRKSKSEENSIRRVLFQELKIQRIDTWELEYTFNGKKYRMLFHGDDLEVIPGKSPIFDYSSDLIDSAWGKYDNGNYTAAGRICDRVAKIDTYELRDNVEKLKNDVDEKLQAAYHTGALTGSLVFGVIALFAVYSYCNNYNHVFSYMSFINRTSNWFHDYHTGTQMLLAVVPVFLGYASGAAVGTGFRWRIPGHIPRFMVGLISAVLFTGLFLGIWWIANAIGVTFLATLFVWIVWKIIMVILIIVVLAWNVVSWVWNLIF